MHRGCLCIFWFRTLCTALAEQEDTEDIDGGQLCLVLQEELAFYKAKRWGIIIVIKKVCA